MTTAADLAWERSITDKWAVSGGAGLEFGAVLGVAAKIFTFTHLPTKKQKTFVLGTASLGAKLELSFEAGSAAASATLKKIADGGAQVKRVAGVVGNPLAASEANDLAIYRPFCVNDLYGAIAYGVSVGADGGIISASVQGMGFRSSRNEKLFSLSGAQVEMMFGVGINMGTLTGGCLYGVRPGLAHRLREQPQTQMRNMQRFGMRAHPGKI